MHLCGLIKEKTNNIVIHVDRYIQPNLFEDKQVGLDAGGLEDSLFIDSVLPTLDKALSYLKSVTECFLLSTFGTNSNAGSKPDLIAQHHHKNENPAAQRPQSLLREGWRVL